MTDADWFNFHHLTILATARPITIRLLAWIA